MKVSIVVPTYAPGDRINGLVRSLDAQTMPTRDFEVIFVDDGSPDDTWKRLNRIKDTHDNVVLERIENSGWPSRPRNVGLELARGEYVLFMDHDDELYPRALEAAYAMASRTGADVLNGKETRTDQSKWALEVYLDNADNVIDRTDIHPLIPTNPHKMFRRELLMEHNIRFPEGRRVLWEDVFFALDVARHSKVISNLSDTPFYHWVRGKTTASSSYTRNRVEFWTWVKQIVLQTNEKLAGPELHQQWRLFLLHQYRSRVLAPLGSPIFKLPQQEFEFVRDTADELVNEHIPQELDAYLTPTQLGRAALVRAGRWDLLEKYVGIDAGIVGITRTSSVRWDGDVLRIVGESRWTAGDKPLQVRWDGDRVVRELPEDIAELLPDAALDMTPAMHAATTWLGVRARETGVTWLLPTTATPRIDDVDGRPELVVDVTAELDPATAIFGKPLDETSWDVIARNDFLGTINGRGVRTDTPGRVTIFGGHVYIGYKNKSGMLSFDIDETFRSLPGSAKLDPARITSTVTGSEGSRLPFGKKVFTLSLELPFSGVATRDDTTLEGTATVGRDAARPASVECRPDGAWLRATFQQRPGTYPLSVNFHGRDVDTGLQLTVDQRGGVTAARKK